MLFPLYKMHCTHCLPRYLYLYSLYLYRLIKLRIKRLGDKNLVVADLLVDLGEWAVLY